MTASFAFHGSLHDTALRLRATRDRVAGGLSDGLGRMKARLRLARKEDVDVA